MGLLNKSGIGNGSTIESLHVTNIYDALNGTGSYQVVATGSFTGTFDGTFTGTATTSSYAISSSQSVLSATSISASQALISNTASYVTTLTQQVDVSGSLRLQKTNRPTPESTSTYLYVSNSADLGDQNEYDLYYTHNGYDFNMGWYESKIDTGIKWGGVVTTSGSTIYVTPGCGIIANHNAITTANGNTEITTVNWGAITASATYLTTSQVSYLLIDQNGSLLQHTSPFTPQEYNEKFPLGYIFSLTTSSISSYSDARVTTYGNDEQQYQFIRSFGPLKIKGYDITAQTSSLKLSIAGGRTYRVGGFYSQNPDEPSIYDSSTVATGSLIRIYRDPAAVGSFKTALSSSGVPFQDIDPTKWDDGTGTLASVGASEWTIQRLFQGPVTGLTYVYYGQNKYASLDAAVQNLATDSFTEADTSIIALPFIGYVVCKGDTTDLTNTTNNRIINAGLFRNTAGSSGGGGASATNLDSLSDVAITSAANGQTIIYDAGNWINKNIFPYTGSANITGSANVTGSITLNSPATYASRIHVSNTPVPSGSLDAAVNNAVIDYGRDGNEGLILQYGGGTYNDQGGIKITPYGVALFGSGDEDLIRVVNEDSGYSVFKIDNTSKVAISDTHLGSRTLTASLSIYNTTANDPSFAVYDTGNGTISPFIVDGDGRVGIGKLNPSASLDISGSGLITGSLRVTSGITGSLFGTSSFAITASHAITASYIAASSLTQNINITGSLVVSGSVSQTNNAIIVSMPSASASQLYGVAVFKYKQFTYNADQAKIYEDDYIRLSYDTSGSDPEVYVLQNPAAGRMQCITFSTKFPGNTVAIDGITSLALTDLWPNGIGSDEVLTSYITAGLDPIYPYYLVTWYRTNTTYGGNISVVVHRYSTNL